MRMLLMLLALAATAATASESWAPRTGPAIEGYGPWMPVETTWEPPAGLRYKLLFDVTPAPEAHDQRSRWIESAARYVNMHVGSGVPLEDIEVAVVLHSTAARSALSPGAYRERFGVEHPDAEMISALAEAGVTIYLCGQTAAYYDYRIEDLHEDVEMSLSAMTAISYLVDRGYGRISY